MAARFHGHSAKRFLLNVAEASPHFGAPDAQELGRFSLSVAQSTDLEPVEAMLQSHTSKCAVMPAVYANQARVSKAFDRLCRVQRVLRAAATMCSQQPSPPPLVGGWGADGVLAAASPDLVA